MVALVIEKVRGDMSSSGQKIPVGQVAGSAIGFAWDNFFTLIRIGWFPILLSSFFSYVGNIPFDPQAPAWTAGVNPLIFTVSYILAFLCWAVFAVSVHRMILVDQESPSGLVYFRVTLDEIRYALAPFVIGIIPLTLIAIGVFLLVGADALSGLQESADTSIAVEGSNIEGWKVAVFIVLLLASIFVYLRLSLSLPIIAAEHKFGLGLSWSLTSGNFWRMILVSLLLFATLIGVFLIVGIAFAALGLAGAGLGVSPSDGGIGTTVTVATVATAVGTLFFLNFLATVISIAVLSFIYQSLTDEALSGAERMEALRSSD